MRRTVLLLCFLLLFCASTVCALEAPDYKSNPVDLLTGELWQKSDPDEKRAFLFGIDTAIAVDYSIDAEIKAKREKEGKGGKRRHGVLSPFQRGWNSAFKDVPRRDIMQQIDAWYESHADAIERPVMSVIWYELIKPKLDEKRKARRAARMSSGQ